MGEKKTQEWVWEDVKVWAVSCELCLAHTCVMLLWIEMSWQHFVQLFINLHHWFNFMILCHTLLRPMLFGRAITSLCATHLILPCLSNKSISKHWECLLLQDYVKNLLMCWFQCQKNCFEFLTLALWLSLFYLSYTSTQWWLDIPSVHHIYSVLIWFITASCAT